MLVSAASVRAAPRSLIQVAPRITVGNNFHQRAIVSASHCRTLSVRGGSSSSSSSSGDAHALPPPPQYTVLSEPAPGSPFHYAFPVHDLQAAREFYGTVLGCVEGRSSAKWQDYSLHGHQIVAHWAGNDYRCQDYYNPVDGDEVPVPRTYNGWGLVVLLLLLESKE